VIRPPHMGYQLQIAPTNLIKNSFLFFPRSSAHKLMHHIEGDSVGETLVVVVLVVGHVRKIGRMVMGQAMGWSDW
jgi:hypothetical protein